MAHSTESGKVMTTKLHRTPLALARVLKREPSHRAVEEGGWTDLHYAAILDLTGLARTLLIRGACVDARLKDDHERLDERISETLRRLGLVLGNWYRDGETPLQLAAWANAAPTAAVLLEHGADVHACTPSGWTGLHAAARSGAAAAAAVLLAHGVDMHRREETASTPLHIAAFYNSLEMVELLLDKGADADATAFDGMTPLHMAAVRNMPGAAGRLLAAGANVNALSKRDGGTPLDFAEAVSSRSTADLLRRHGGEMTIEDKFTFMGVVDAKLGGGWGVMMPMYRRTRSRRAPGGQAPAARRGR